MVVVSAVFVGVDTSNPSLVAQAVANYMYEHSDQLLPSEATAIYEQMYSYGVGIPRAVGNIPSAWPSWTG